MTFAMSLKVGSGIVLAADSASTMMARDSEGASLRVANIYRNANKVFNLVKGLPLGIVCWGLGGIGAHSIDFLFKELREKATSGLPEHDEWYIDPGSFTVEHAASLVKRHIYDNSYVAAFEGTGAGAFPTLGMLIAGYSSGARIGEVFEIEVGKDGECHGPTLLSGTDEPALLAYDGMYEAVSRLMFGYSPSIDRVLERSMGVPADQIPTVMRILEEKLTVPLLNPMMPIQDAVDLARFLVDTAVKWSRFMPEPELVGGEIEIAAITKHEGFKWVSRKYYYDRRLNPQD